jgi:PAS domain-containing protein
MNQVYTRGRIPAETKSEDTAPNSEVQSSGDSSEEFRAIFENSQIGIMLLKQYRVIFRANQRLDDILGYDSP